MIFVTVGTHEQPFNRLIQCMDELKRDRVINEDVFIQIGYSTYKPRYCEWNTLISYEQIVKNITNARIVITHGGPASFIMPLQLGKIPIVVPRQQKYGEHVNDHQIEFVDNVAQKQKNIIPVKEIDDLKKAIAAYDDMVKAISTEFRSNNKMFCDKFSDIVSILF